MNTSRKGIIYLVCTKCPNLYARVGTTPIGLANPPRRPFKINEDPTQQGPCPNHPRRLGE